MTTKFNCFILHRVASFKKGLPMVVVLLLCTHNISFCQIIPLPKQPSAPVDSLLKAQVEDVRLRVTQPFEQFQNIDSLIEAQFQNASANVLNKLKSVLTSSLKDIRKNRLSMPNMPTLNGVIVQTLKKNKIGDVVASTEASEWKTNGSDNIFLQANVNAGFTLAGIPLSGEALSAWNFFNSGTNQRFTYHVNYNKNEFLEKLGINKTDLKKQMADQLNFDQVVNYKEVINKTFADNSTLSGIMKTTGCNWDHLMDMPMSEFKKIYNKDVLKSKIADAEKLKKYYVDYAAKTKDSIIQSKVAAADSQLNKLKTASVLYEKLITIKQKADKLTAKVVELKKAYEEKVKVLMETYNVVNDVIKNNKDLSSLQKFMLKVKGLNIGQHTLSTGNLVLQNYLQNGVTFEYETDRSYLLLTKGSQNKIEYLGSFFQNTVNNQAGVNEYYQFNSRYKLTGVSLGRGNKETNYRQFSLMNFEKVDNYPTPSLVGKTVNVFTISNQMVSAGGQKLTYDISKSTVKQTKSYEPAGNNRGGETAFLQSIAVNIKYNYTSKATQDNQKLLLFYSAPSYNNPGINGGIGRPGLQLQYGFKKNLSKRFRVGNQLTYYAFKYGNSVSFKSLRDRVDVSYKIKRMRIGLMVNGNYGNQLQYNPKFAYKTRSMDLLATAQTHKRLGSFLFNVNGGLGYGYNKQESFNKVKDWSFYTSSSISYKGLSLNINADKFNTKNTEVFLFDSTALVLESSFNLDGALSYCSKNGNIVEAGVKYQTLNNNARQFFITASADWRILRRVSISGNLNLPLSAATNIFINNIFNSKIIYNIKGHDN